MSSRIFPQARQSIGSAHPVGSGLPDRPWHRSLYWRIALGYVLSIALLLTAQLVIFINLADHRDRLNEADRLQRIERLQVFGQKLSQSLESAPNASLESLLESLNTTEHVFLVMKDGRVVGRRLPSTSTQRIVIEGLGRLQRAEDFPQAWTRSDYGGAPILKDGRIVGAVGILPPTTFERYRAAIVAAVLVLLVTGTVLLSLIVVAPIRSRLRQLQTAAADLRDGDLTARAHLQGADEIRDVAQVFNEMAEELSRRTTDLETSDRLRRQLIADVSHELMTPLTSVLGHLETLSMEEVDLDRAERLNQVSIAIREARRLERLIGDLLNTARLESEGSQLDIQQIDLSALFDEVTTRHEPECRTRGISMTTSISDNLTSICADRFRIEQAIDNLVVNALRHTSDGGRVELKARADAGCVLLEVTDSGAGIAAEHLPFIFDRFYKASSADGIASPGSGLGLSIVKAIVMRHGGRASATSKIGVGTTVTLEFPA